VFIDELVDQVNNNDGKFNFESAYEQLSRALSETAMNEAISAFDEEFDKLICPPCLI